MQASHRRLHARIWLAWAILLPLGFILALLLREPDPVDADQPAPITTTQPAGGS